MAGPGLSLKLGQRQKLSQTMTPALQQALKLLQLSNIQLDAVVQEALETNPLLAMDEPSSDPPAAPPPIRRQPGAGYKPTPAAARLFGAAATGSGKAQSAAGSFEGADGDADIGGPGQSLRDLLYEDITFAFPDLQERNIAIDLTGMLDEAGYLAGDIEDVADIREVEAALVADVLDRLQKLAPAGLFARDLAECLRLQLVENRQLDDAMSAVLDHLSLLTERGPEALAAAAGVDGETLARCLEQMRGLNPRPGAELAETEAPAIVPDLIICEAGEETPFDASQAQTIGRWTIALNPDLLPKLSLDKAGLAALKAQSRQASDKSYLKDQAQDATWLIRAIEQRTATILRVGVEIFRRQEAFLDEGVTGLRPLTQKEISISADVHESTISRAANDKFAATPQGVLPLKFLFSAKIGDLNGGDGHAAKVVRHRLKSLIQDEQAPLSDDALTRLLRAEGYDVARRTVAKYREMLRIPSSVQRRRLKKVRQPTAPGTGD